jgi:hypothetical protein
LPLRDRARTLLKGGEGSPRRAPVLSFVSWEEFPRNQRVIQVCHPDWRGVRTATYAFRSPVVECDDLDYWSDDLSDQITRLEIETVVIQGWPPGAARFAGLLAERGIKVKCVLHSSPAQHGAEAGEAQVADEVLTLGQTGTLAGVGMVKSGVAEAFRAAGHHVVHVPNRAPDVPPITRIDLGPGLHVGVFAAPFWRKNVVTQLLSLSLLDEAVGHVLEKPSVGYLHGVDIVEHGELPWPEFMALQGSVAVNLYVTLTECHPLSPIESYLLGVPCLLSRTSELFRDDRVLWELTTIDMPDDPSAISKATTRLLEGENEALERARAWIDRGDDVARSAWEQFTR